MRNRILGLVVGAGIALVSQAVPAQEVQGTWQLVEVTIPNLMDTNPRGIPAVKEYYRADGRLFFIAPTAVMNDQTQSYPYRIDGAQRTMIAPNGRHYVATLSFPAPGTLVVTQSSGDQWRYTRLGGEDAANQKVEPHSVEVLKIPGARDTPDVQYDDRDHSALPLKKRIVGVWEAIAYRNVDRNSAPPYGFFNDVWTFDVASASIAVRALDGGVKPVKAGYSIKNDKLMLQNNATPVAVSFDEWGHLVLEFDTHTVVLKLLQKQSNLPPLKITLLSLRGEPG